jgi:hypothetical protein
MRERLDSETLAWEVAWVVFVAIGLKSSLSAPLRVVPLVFESELD